MHAAMAGTRRIALIQADGVPAVQRPARVRAMWRRCLVGVLGLLSLGAMAPLAHADGRPPDASGTVCTYRVPEAPPYDTPEGHVRVHYVADPADRDSPSPASSRVAG